MEPGSHACVRCISIKCRETRNDGQLILKRDFITVVKNKRKEKQSGGKKMQRVKDILSDFFQDVPVRRMYGMYTCGVVVLAPDCQVEWVDDSEVYLTLLPFLNLDGIDYRLSHVDSNPLSLSLSLSLSLYNPQTHSSSTKPLSHSPRRPRRLVIRNAQRSGMDWNGLDCGLFSFSLREYKVSEVFFVTGFRPPFPI